MVDVARARRLSVRVRQVVAVSLERQVKDPRVDLVTITDARMTPDLREATLFYTVLGDEQSRTDAADALEAHKGKLRSEVGRQTGVRYTPSLTFILDAVPDNARAIDELLAAARARDAAVAAAAAGAQPAGEADPYRQLRETEPDSTDELAAGPAVSIATDEPDR